MSEEIKTPMALIPIPKKSFGDLALRVATDIYDDIHINVSGFAFFTIYGYGILNPEVKDTCNQLAMLAGTYLFASAKKN